MKFQKVLRIAGCSAWVWAVAAASERPVKTNFKISGKSLAELVENLGDDNFKIRENATREIWGIGKPALRALREIASGQEPESAYRARELIRKIEWQVTPETEPAVVALAERYAKASPNEKITVFEQLHKLRAWRQILALYAAEADSELQARLQATVVGFAVVAARECLLAGDAKAAREFLEMAPASAGGLLALADFHRSHGTLDAELKRAKTLKGEHAEAWQLALNRVAGNLEAAKNCAAAAGENKISAIMAALLGDPLPWLHQSQSGEEGEKTDKFYPKLAIKRCQGQALLPADLEPLTRAANSGSSEERERASHCLFLLGETDLAEKAYTRNSPVLAFSYFESLERISEALKALGLDPEHPDYAAWVANRLLKLTKKDAEDEHDVSTKNQELIVLANFLERRGLDEQGAAAFLKPMAALADEDSKVFVGFLRQLFGGSRRTSSEGLGAPQIAKLAAIAWAGDHAERWEEVLIAAFGEQDGVITLWDGLAELEPKASRLERLDGMLALAGMMKDPQRLRERWLERAWTAVDQAPAENRKVQIERMLTMSALSPDVLTSLKAWDQLPESSRGGLDLGMHIFDLSAANHWNEAANFFQQQIEVNAAAKLDPQPSLYAYLATCLRQAGRAKEAAVEDKRVDQLALGNESLEIGRAYAYGNDYKRAGDWWGRAIREGDPDTEDFILALQLNSEMGVEQGNWKQVAALGELRAQLMATSDSGGFSPLLDLRLRLQSDLGRALSQLKANRAGSLALLENCHRMFPSDGSLGDDFFPAIRKMGLLKEHDAWFKISWAKMTAVIEQFPNSDNPLNTAAWLASRACRNLDQAQGYLEKALVLNPNQSAYLDTMAEIQFAKGNREKALEWSVRAVNFLPLDIMLRRQQDRYRRGPLPR